MRKIIIVFVGLSVVQLDASQKKIEIDMGKVSHQVDELIEQTSSIQATSSILSKRSRSKNPVGENKKRKNDQVGMVSVGQVTNQPTAVSPEEIVEMNKWLAGFYKKTPAASRQEVLGGQEQKSPVLSSNISKTSSNSLVSIAGSNGGSKSKSSDDVHEIKSSPRSVSTVENSKLHKWISDYYDQYKESCKNFDNYIYRVQCAMQENPPLNKREFIGLADKIRLSSEREYSKKRFALARKAVFDQFVQDVLDKDKPGQKQAWRNAIAYKMAHKDNLNIIDYESDHSDY